MTTSTSTIPHAMTPRKSRIRQDTTRRHKRKLIKMRQQRRVSTLSSLWMLALFLILNASLLPLVQSQTPLLPIQQAGSSLPPPCSLTSLELSQLDENDDVEPCLLYDIAPESDSSSITIPIVQVTPSSCNEHRDGSVLGNLDFYTTFR